MPIAKVHALLGHHSEAITRKIAKELGWTISRGSMKPCEACTIAKARQKNVPKTHGKNKNTAKANERWSHDISTVKAPRGEGITVTRPV